MTKLDDSRGAQRAVDYLGILGKAALADHAGEIHLSSARKDVEKLAGVARLVARANVRVEQDPPNRVACLDAPATCTYYARVGDGFLLFVIAEQGVSPAAVIDRLTSVVAVFDRVMSRAATPPGGGPGGGPGGTPDASLAFAEAVRAPPRRS